jgi:hypothetical protein
LDSSLSSLIEAAETGRASDTEALFAAPYSELHRLARRELAGRGEVTLSVTTLLHEAYLGFPTGPALWVTPRESCAD